MALKTLGTNLTTTLNAIVANKGVYSGAASAADLATLRANIKDDIGNAHKIWQFAFHNGILYIPNRGVLRVLDGDYVAYDSRGWPILVSKDTIANGPWTHS